MARCEHCGNTSHRVSELWCDPASGELSASRLIFLVVNLVFLPGLVYLAIAYGLNFTQIVKLVLGLNAAPAMVYGFNSAAGAWKSWRKIEKDKGGAAG